jgi:hypothetical protein
MIKSKWSRVLTLAASGMLAEGVAGTAQATETYQIRADWLDPGISADRAAQKLIIDELAQGRPIVDDRFDDYGLTETAAAAIRQARNNGTFGGASFGETSSQWWQRAEPALADTLATQSAREAERQRDASRWAMLMTLGTFVVAGAAVAYDMRHQRPSPQGPGGPRGGKPKLVYRNPEGDVTSTQPAVPARRFANRP